MCLFSHYATRKNINIIRLYNSEAGGLSGGAKVRLNFNSNCVGIRKCIVIKARARSTNSSIFDFDTNSTGKNFE